MEVPVEACPTLRLDIPCVHPTLLVKPIALVPSSTVLRPWTHADPAELPFTFLACHVARLGVSTSAKQDLDEITHLHPPFFSMVD